jgi:hypothetical protein
VTLRNARIAIVDVAKVGDYLLNASHPENGGKAEFFRRLGYVRERPEALAEAHRSVASAGTIATSAQSPHGQKFVVDGDLPAPTGQTGGRAVRTVWIINTGEDVPRLVTAYPARG